MSWVCEHGIGHEHEPPCCCTRKEQNGPDEPRDADPEELDREETNYERFVLGEN